MFESTIEAQALHAGDKRLGTLSAAVLAHLAIGVAVVAVAAVIVPDVITPEPMPVWFIQPPIPRGDPTPVPPAGRPPHGGHAPNVSKALSPPRLEPPVPPAATPDTLPTAASGAPGADDASPLAGDGDGGGASGLMDGPGDGAPGEGTGPGAGAPLELTGDMLRPVLLVKVEPVYPTTARIARLPGKVLVQAVIGPDGSVESAEVLSSTSTLFDAAALDAVRQWRYSPATMNGRPVRVYFKVSVTFTLR